jgi:hypothetical protein
VSSAAQTERQSQASADKKIKHEHNSSLDSINYAALSPEKPDHECPVIAEQSIDSFKLKPEFVGTANKEKKGLPEFNSNIQQPENDQFASPVKTQYNNFTLFLRSTFSLRRTET